MRDNRYARVVAIQPGGYSVDLLFLDDFSRVPAVQVLSPSASTNTGLADLAVPVLADPANKFNPKESKDRDIYAVVGYVKDAPVVMGFLFPQVCQMLFADMNRRVDRHASDVYSTIDGDGNAEWYHPSGTYFRIGVTPAHEDLTGLDVDAKWKIAKNKTKHVHLHLEVQKEGVLKASVDIDPDGNVVVTNAGTLMSTSGGDITVQTTSANATLKAATTVKLDAPNVHMTGDAQVDGTLTATTDVIGGGKHLKTHTHGGVAAGTAHTAAPD